MTVTVDTSQADKFASILSSYSKKNYAFATRATINEMGFQLQKLSRSGLHERMILRNKWTESSIRRDKARTLKIADQKTEVGSILNYMERQEKGGIAVSQKKHGIPIPTKFSSAEEGQEKRKRIPIASNRLKAIQLRHSSELSKFKTRKQKNIVAVKLAIQHNNRFVYLETEKRKGIYRITRGRSRVKNERQRLQNIFDNSKIKLVHDLTHNVIIDPKNAWLFPHIKRVKKVAPDIYFKEVVRQMHIAGLSSFMV